jgi:hypothetical protein
MRRLLRLLLICLLMCLLAGLAPAQTSVDSTLRHVESLYSAGAYAQAELEARRVLESDLLSDSVWISAEQWVAFSLVAQGKTALAKEHFLGILRRQPSHELDPILTSPKILAVFNDARATFLAQRAQEVDSSLIREASVPTGVTFRTIVFPGWEQWYHGRTPIGPIFVGAGVATLGSGIALAFLRKSAHKDYLAATAPDDIEAKYNTYNRYAKAESYCFAAFAVVYLLSEIDVIMHNSPVTLAPSIPAGASVAGTGVKLMYALP